MPKKKTNRAKAKPSKNTKAMKPFDIPIDPVSAATGKVATQLVELCRTGMGHKAIQKLYSNTARHVEAMSFPGSPYKRIMKGKATLIKMSEHWGKTTTVHSCSVSDPRVNGDQFACEMKLDATSHEGPMAGMRMDMEETCVYTVKNGKITEARFFYGCQP